ncbi:hypothetical protein SRS16CHR_04828 [Variovorax sp. SRS16]|nr:hypothetical protein SRS16CHR_04828 [Variovorax sp. SRS16]
MRSQSVGALVLDTQGAVVHATGIACDCAVQRSMCRLLDDVKAGRLRGAGTLTTNCESHCVEILRCIDSDILLVYDARRRDDRSARA